MLSFSELDEKTNVSLKSAVKEALNYILILTLDHIVCLFLKTKAATVREKVLYATCLAPNGQLTANC